MNPSWYLGSQNDALYVIDQPPRPSTDDINPDQNVNVIAKVYEAGTHDETDKRGRTLAAALTLRAFAEEFVELFRDSDMRPERECSELYIKASMILEAISGIKQPSR